MGVYRQHERADFRKKLKKIHQDYGLPAADLPTLAASATANP